MAYVMLTGISPFLGENKQETFLNISHLNVNYHEEELQQLDQAATSFIQMLLRKYPQSVQTSFTSQAAQRRNCRHLHYLTHRQVSDRLTDSYHVFGLDTLISSGFLFLSTDQKALHPLYLTHGLPHIIEVYDLYCYLPLKCIRDISAQHLAIFTHTEYIKKC